MAKLVRIVPAQGSARTLDDIIEPGRLTRREWAKRLNEQWDAIRSTAVLGFMQLGRDLLQAKHELEHGQWMRILEHDLKFHQRVANKFMRLARWCSQNGLIESNLIRLLPPDYNTIDGIIRLSEDAFQRLVRDGTINPSVQRNEIARILRLQQMHADEQRVLNLVPVPGLYRGLVLDPGWEYEQSVAGRAAGLYATQSINDLLALDVRAWADESAGCHLYLWTTNAFMAEACKLVAHWGFQHRTIITWIKPPPFGLGNYFRNSTEQCLFATLGDTTTRPAAASIPTHFEAPRGEHSEKPEKFYDIVRAASYPPYGEANQREARPDFANLFEAR